jgi:hypothetical protein
LRSFSEETKSYSQISLNPDLESLYAATVASLKRVSASACSPRWLARPARRCSSST